jgi:nucleotide-binding universal stress UspA family protein
VAGTTVLHDDRPAHALALLAEAAPAAVLVVAGHGRTGWSRLLDGSTTAALVREAPVPVLLVPHGGTAGPA